ncbi:flagellar biosynthetic protein FliO [Saccharospirillum impatiens]|uniref:flagellar biosynthetic protein FliO n=1 Tax=Saccharospirillum impatiens TaxID=169438 RepID=UPI0004201EE5|nr:flagellar biosynthetic protein FliO [Saccharospirillum impatiens]
MSTTIFDACNKTLTSARPAASVGLFLLPLSWANASANSAIPGGGSDYMRLGLTLLFIVGLIFACGWLVRRMAGGSGFNNRHIKVLSVMPLGTREKLMLIKAADETLLIGVTSQSISTLHRYDGPLDLTDTMQPSPFADRMKGLLKGLDSDSLAKHNRQKTPGGSDSQP